jgi:hypothetical protein
VADALSRRSFASELHDSPTCFSLLVCQPKRLEQVLHSYDQDEYAKEIIAKFALLYLILHCRMVFFVIRT